MPGIGRSPRSAIATRLAVLGGCAVFALAALGSGLDRMAEADAAAAGRVPGLFSSMALRSEARAAIQQGDAVAGLALGAAAIDNAPTDPESAALLGAARLGSGDRSGAERAFRVAGQLGWRVAFTQLYWMGRALEAGDYRVAAMRLDAVLRQQPALLANASLLDPMERDPRGRAALAERMMAGPGWLRDYGMRVEDLPRERLLGRAALLGDLARRGGALGCEAVGPLVQRLIDAGDVAAGSAVWRGHCPGAARSVLYDGSFAAARLDQADSQFAWTFLGQSDTIATLEPGPGGIGQTILAESSAARARLMVRQLVLASPGRYRISWRAEASDGAASDRVLGAFSCESDPASWLPASFDAAARRWNAIATIDAACPAHWLAFGLAGRPGPTRFGDVRLDPLP